MPPPKTKPVSPEIKKFAERFGVNIYWDESVGGWAGSFPDLQIEIVAGTDREALAGVLDSIVEYLSDSDEEE
jgi:hypothetical protein